MNKVDNFTNDQLQELVYESTSYTDLARKLGYRTKSGAIINLIERELISRNITVKFAKRTTVKRCPGNIFVKDSTADQKVLVRWYKEGEYSPYECAICGMPPEWNGKPLTLRLDHISGDNKDDRLENLRWVCPNCDSQLPTYGARNIK